MDEGIKQAVDLIYDRTGILVPAQKEIKKAENLTPTEIVRLMSHGYALSPHYTDEQIAEYKERRIRETKMDKVKVLVHEFGHYLHHNCYGFEGKRIPIAGSKMKKYCQKNAKENFAVAFTEYVLREIKEDSPRYKRMNAIMKTIRESPEEEEYDEVCV